MFPIQPKNFLCIALLGTVLALGATGCAKKAKATSKGTFPTGTEKSALTTDGADSTTGGSTAHGTSGGSGAPDPLSLDASGSSSRNRMGSADADGDLAEGERGEAGEQGVAISDLPNVYFELDQAGLSSEATATLDKNAEYLQANPQYFVVLRGHTDDSGTEEYNRSLGSRRAQTVRDYLVNKGVDAGRLETLSFGEDLPAVQGEDEASRSQNRRVEFFVYTQ